ncbi:hypothetical protein DL93DRAFT_2167508 [Clavulina sp. PMI_390]|nr:hypothetical protein DL93DRAFT_2167508 [Clavulina sp. PMI_390]
MKPPSFIPLNALPDSSKPFKRALGAAGSTPLHIGANDQSSRSPATAVKLPSFIPPGTAEVGEEMSIDLPSFTPSRPTALELAYTALEHDLISATTFPTPPPAPSKKEKHTLGLAKAVEKENQLPPANTKRRLEARSSLRRPATSAAKMRTPLVVKERKPGLKATGKEAGNPSSARPSELSGRSGKTQLRKSGHLASKVKRESLKEKRSDGKGGGNSSNVTSVATGSKVMRTSVKKIASVGANVDVRSKGTSPTIEGASNLAVLEASARVCPDHGEAPSVIPSETLDLAAVLKNTTPLSYERPPSGIFTHVTNLSMRPLLVQVPPKERKSGHHDVSAYRARDRSASQSSSGSSTSYSTSAMISPRISVSSSDVFFNKVSTVTPLSATLASSLSSTDTPPALNDTNTASETSKHSTLIPDPVSPISFASYLSDSSSVGSGGTDSDPDTPTTPLSSKLLTPCLDIHSSVETPTALRLHSLRLQCTGRMPTKTLSAAIDWIESENYLGLSPRLPLPLESRADVRRSVGLEAQAPEKETPAEDTLQRPLATARAPHPANSRQGDANLGRIPVRSNGIGDATGTFPLRSHNATTRTPGATNDTGTSGRVVGLQGRRQLLLTTGFWARGRRTSPGALGGEAMLRHEHGKRFSTSKGKGGVSTAFSELGSGRLNHVVTNVEQKGVPADGKVGDELVGEADADAEEPSVEDRDQNEHEEEKDKAITSQFVQLPQE